MENADETPRPSRGRIVMLVQNAVEGDSRVQKQAASIAALGWEVTLLGRSPDDEERTWSLDGAEVRLLPVRPRLGLRHEVRGHWFRDPLAFPRGPLHPYRRRQLQAWRAEIQFIKARQAVAAAHQPALVTRVRKAALLPRRARVKLIGKWTDIRAQRTVRMRERRSMMTGSVDRLAVRFWQVLLRDRAWRRLDPALWDLEFAFGPVIDELRPDLIHANDFQMLGVGARAKVRALAEGRPVKLVWDVHEFLPGMRSWSEHPGWKPAQIAHENEYARYADAVVTVSSTLSELLAARHGLTDPPTVVLNTPDLDGAHDGEAVPDLRERCGIGPDVPLLVYSGASAERRGLGTMVESLPELPGVHAAFVTSRGRSPYMRGLYARAVELGVAERVHFVPYVPHWQIVPHLAGADIGVIPIHHYLNHEIALITKFFEYSHARLPIVVSDVETMSAMVRATGQGEVFRAEDTADFAEAVRRVLADPERYDRAYATEVPLGDWTWRAQAGILDEVYTKALVG
jgi:glycosyltransferase involved in cell wall biosynthesis